MTIKNYADILKLVINMQIDYAKEALDKPNANEDYLGGVINGLETALEKIDASMFLAND